MKKIPSVDQVFLLVTTLFILIVNRSCFTSSASAGCIPDANNGSISVPLFAQQTSMWCWAACGEMCMEFLGATDIKQCIQANENFSKTTCCNSIVPQECINGAFPQFEKYNFPIAALTIRR